MKVLIVHRYVWPETVSVLPLMFSDIIDWHQNSGDSVDVITGSVKSFREEREQRFGEYVITESFISPPDRELSKAARSINFAKLLFGALKKIKSEERYSIIYLVSYPPLFALVLMTLTKLMGKSTKYVFYLQDNMEYRVPTMVLKRAYRWAQYKTISESWKTLTISPSMKSHLVAGNKDLIFDNKISVIPNYAMELEYNVGAVDKQYDIIFTGGIGLAQNLLFFLNAISRAKLHHLKIAFFGSGTMKQKVMQEAASLGLNVVFHAPIGREEVSAEIAKAKYGLVGAKDDLMKYAFPSKLASYCAVGTPGIVMCCDSEPMGNWIKDNGLGVLISPTSVEEAAVQLLEIFSSDQGHRYIDLRTKAKTVFGKAKYLEKFAGIVNQARVS